MIQDNDSSDELYPEGFDNDDEEFLVPCPNCRAEIHEDSVRCPECGEYITFDRRPWSSKPAWLRHLAIAMLILAIAGFLIVEFRHWLGWQPEMPGVLEVKD